MTSQMRRAAISIPANLAEGASCGGLRELSRFLNIAGGSLAELRTHIRLSREMAYLSEDAFSRLDRQSRELESAMNAFAARLRQRSSERTAEAGKRI